MAVPVFRTAKPFATIGDETRQLILLVLLESDLSGIRVGEITDLINLIYESVKSITQS